MFCPQCGYQQGSMETRFCSRCGLPFGLVTDLLANSSHQLQREKRELTGIGFIMATVLMLLNFLLVFGVVTLPHLANPVFLWIWIFFLLSALITGGLGLANLIRGGFFKKLKERDARLSLMKSDRENQMLPTERSRESLPPAVDRFSVTEPTTRKLQANPRNTASHKKSGTAD